MTVAEMDMYIQSIDGMETKSLLMIMFFQR